MNQFIPSGASPSPFSTNLKGNLNLSAMAGARPVALPRYLPKIMVLHFSKSLAHLSAMAGARPVALPR